jgi:hypothetical protein
LTSDIDTKIYEDQNIFMIECAGDPSYSAPIEELHRFNINDLLRELKAQILTKNLSGLKRMQRLFKDMDKQRNGQLDVDDFRWAFIDYGYNLA